MPKHGACEGMRIFNKKQCFCMVRHLWMNRDERGLPWPAMACHGRPWPAICIWRCFSMVGHLPAPPLFIQRCRTMQKHCFLLEIRMPSHAPCFGMR